MKDKDILNMLGLNDRTITLTADDQYIQIMLEKKIDKEKKKQEQIDYYKNQYEKFQKKNEFFLLFTLNNLQIHHFSSPTGLCLLKKITIMFVQILKQVLVVRIAQISLE